MKTRMLLSKGNPVLAGLIKKLRQNADDQMRVALWCVTTKSFTPPSGDKHDYVSLASYFWPNPNTPDGLPYVPRDGEINPETHNYDRDRLDGMAKLVHTLALAYYFTGDEAYARRAADQLRMWFVNSDTRMNPDLRYTQMIRGKNSGRPSGIIETEVLTQVVDADALLAGSDSWPSFDHRRLQLWFKYYLRWLLKAGQLESLSSANHGTYYDLQAADFALFVGQDHLAKNIIDTAKTKRIAKQITPEGLQPKELARTKSWHYVQLNLTGLFKLARLGEHVGMDIWHYQTADGRSIRHALDWLVPYAVGDKPWKYKQIAYRHNDMMVYLLRQAANVYKDPAYENAIGRLTRVKAETLEETNLLYPSAQLIQSPNKVSRTGILK